MNTSQNKYYYYVLCGIYFYIIPIWCIKYHYSFPINLIKLCIVLLRIQLGFPLECVFFYIFPAFLCEHELIHVKFVRSKGAQNPLFPGYTCMHSLLLQTSMLIRPTNFDITNSTCTP